MSHLYELVFSAESVWHISYAELTLRLVGSLVLGGIIGLERELSNHAAGFRTHILVCTGSAAIMLLSIYGFSSFVDEPNVRIDPARLAAQVISGIGFLGAGAILRTGASVTGLTTAASIWVVAAIGLSIGAGFFYAACLCTILVFLSLFFLNKWEGLLKRKKASDQVIVINMRNQAGNLGKILEEFNDRDIIVTGVKMNVEAEAGRIGQGIVELVLTFKCVSKQQIMGVVEQISFFSDVASCQIHSFKEQVRG